MSVFLVGVGGRCAIAPSAYRCRRAKTLKLSEDWARREEGGCSKSEVRHVLNNKDVEERGSVRLLNQC